MLIGDGCTQLVYAAIPSFSINVEPVITGKTGSEARIVEPVMGGTGTEPQKQ